MAHNYEYMQYAINKVCPARHSANFFVYISDLFLYQMKTFVCHSMFGGTGGGGVGVRKSSVLYRGFPENVLLSNLGTQG